MRVLFGEVFCRWGGGDSLWGAASRLLGGREAFRGYASHKCRLIPPSSVACATNCLQFSFPPRGSLLYVVRTWQIWLCIVVYLCDPPSSSCRVVRKDSRKKASPRGEAGATATDEGDQSPPAQCLQTLAPPPTKKARSRTLQNLPTSQSNQKASPKSTRAMQSETTLCHEKAGALGGSSRREWEVWRERDAS